MAKKRERLHERGGIYYLRIKAPEALRDAGLIGFREYKWSLKTSDPVEAHRLLKIQQVAIDAEIAAARRKLEGRVIKTLARSEMEHLAVQLFHRKEAKRVAAAGGGPDALSPDEAKAKASDWLDQLRAPDDDEARTIVNNSAKRLLSDNDVDLDIASPEWRDFLVLVRRVYLEEADRGNFAEVRALGPIASRKVRAHKATKRAADVLPVILDIQASGASLRGIAAELTSRGIPAPRGGPWAAIQASRLLARISA